MDKLLKWHNKIKFRVVELVAGFALYYIGYGGYKDNNLAWLFFLIAVVAISLSNYAQGRKGSNKHVIPVRQLNNNLITRYETEGLENIYMEYADNQGRKELFVTLRRPNSRDRKFINMKMKDY